MRLARLFATCTEPKMPPFSTRGGRIQRISKAAAVSAWNARITLCGGVELSVTRAVKLNGPDFAGGPVSSPEGSR